MPDLREVHQLLQLHQPRGSGPPPGGEIPAGLRQDPGLSEGEVRPALHQEQETQAGGCRGQASQYLAPPVNLDEDVAHIQI